MMSAFWKRWRRELAVGALVAADGAAVLAVFMLAYWLRYTEALGEPHRPGFAPYLEAAVLMMALWIVLFARFDLYRTRRTWRLVDLVFAAGGAVSIGMCAFLSLSYLRHEFVYSRLVLGGIWALGITATVAIRLALRHAMVWLRRRGLGVRQMVIVGDNGVAQSLVQAIRQHPELGYSVKGLLRPQAGSSANGGVSGETWEGTRGVAEELARRGTDDVVIAMPIGANEELRDFVGACQEQGIRVRLVPDLYELHSPSAQITTVETIPLVALRERALSVDDVMRRGVDLALSAIVLVFVAPVLLMAAGAIRRYTGSGAFRWRTLAGREGVPFRRLELAFPPNSFYGRWVGHPLVRALPGLINVLRGEMSLVGPRPGSLEDARRLNSWQRRRLFVRPGLTGLAQLDGFSTARVGNAEITRDVSYVEQRSVGLDVKILIRAAWAVVRGELSAPRLPSRRLVPRPAEPPRPLEAEAPEAISAVG
jgi:lipopolysaccharide/colanic/teichoic acid biosynthesis glycosyltransferase